MDKNNCELSRYLLPAADGITKPVIELWRDCFGEEEVSGTRTQFMGEEADVDEDILYVLSCKGRMASCCHVTRKKGTGMAGLGGVATVPEFRGRGFSRKVCSFALQDFDASGGEVIWLGTSNPAAANLYHSLGFSFLPGTQVMRRLRKGLTDTCFLEGFFKASSARVRNGSDACRIPMIPLLTSRLGFAVMDCIAGFYGSEDIVECSCMGIYPAYESVRAANGNWHCIDSGFGRIGGLGSWRPFDDGTVMVDGFWHPNYREQACELFRTLIEAARTAGRRIIMPVADVDEAKAELAEQLGAIRGPERLWQPRPGFLVQMRDFIAI